MKRLSIISLVLGAVVVLALIVAGVTGLTASAPAPPLTITGKDTPYSNNEIGVTATLPGAHWHRSNDDYASWLITDGWDNTENKMMFQVSMGQGAAGGDLKSHALEYAAVTGYLSGDAARNEKFHGYDSIRLEQRTANASLYHAVDYAILARGRYLYVGAACLKTDWDSGGKEAIEKILDSVQIK